MTDHQDAGAGRARLPRQFHARPAPEVGPDLLGCVLEHESADGLVAVELTEVEAYAGEADPASHAYRGRTARNAVMFGPAGHAYVYFTYGMHYCVNVVCGPPGVAEAVLLRAGRIIVGEDIARSRRAARPGTAALRGMAGSGGMTDSGGTAGPAGMTDSGGTAGSGRALAARDLARGPARLCQALAIDRGLDGADLCSPASPIRLRAAEVASSRARGSSAVAVGPRVGVRLGAETPWRFWTAGDPTVSVYRPHVSRPVPRR